MAKRNLHLKNPDVKNFMKRNRSIVYGTYLGDASIPPSSFVNGKGLLTVAHSFTQRGYVFHKYKLFKEVAYPPTEFSKINNDGYMRTKISFNCVKSKEWVKVWKIFHKGSRKRTRNGKTYIPKIVNKEILNCLDDRGVALWWMDDGFVTFDWNERTRQWREYAKLSTCDFTWKENDLILTWFKNRYGCNGKVETTRTQVTNRKYPVIYFSWQEFLKIALKIAPYVPPCMKHKIELQAAKIWAERSLLTPHGVNARQARQLARMCNRK